MYPTVPSFNNNLSSVHTLEKYVPHDRKKTLDEKITTRKLSQIGTETIFSSR